MYKPGPIQLYHFQPVSIWWDSPFKAFEEKKVVLSGYQTQAPCVGGRHLSERETSQVLSGCNLLKNPHTSPYIVYDSQAYTIKKCDWLRRDNLLLKLVAVWRQVKAVLTVAWR